MFVLAPDYDDRAYAPYISRKDSSRMSVISWSASESGSVRTDNRTPELRRSLRRAGAMGLADKGGCVPCSRGTTRWPSLPFLVIDAEYKKQLRNLHLCLLGVRV